MSDRRDDLRDKDNGAGGPLLRLFGAQLLAVLAITVVLTGIFALVKGGDDTTTAAVQEPAASTGSATSAPASAAPASSAPPSTAPAPTTSTARPSTSPRDARPEIVVFSQSGSGASGQDAARRLRDKGWTVFKVDDFRGNVTTTTVYYPEGLSEAARQAAGDLPGDVRTRAKFSNLSDTRLTLILTDDFGGDRRGGSGGGGPGPG